MRSVGGSTSQHDPEFDQVQWFDADDALKELAYANEAKVLQRALVLLSQRTTGAS